MSRREPNWDVDRLNGELAELAYRVTRMAMIVGSAEVKRDDRGLETGNIFIEFKCFRQGQWTDSGIATTKSDTWVTYIWPFFIAAPTWMVKKVCRTVGPSAVRENKRGSHPTKGFVIPQRDYLVLLAEAANEPLTEAEAA